MTATVIKVSAVLQGSGKPYQMVFFRFEGGGSALTYLSPGMRNYKQWEPHLKVGAVLENLVLLKDGKTIDADSKPKRVKTLEQPELL